MAVQIKILATAFDAGQPLEAYATRPRQAFANTLQYPAVPAALNDDATTPRIATASPLTARSNILEDGTFPTAPGTTIDQKIDVVVHVSPTSGSTVIRGNNWDPSKAEFDPAYGLDVTVSGVAIQDDVFESAINEPIGAQFTANLQDLVARGILEVKNSSGAVLDPGEIADFVAL